MKKFSTLKGRALLAKVSPLAPVLRNDTRWTSEYALVDRYAALLEAISLIDHGSLEAHGLQPFLLTRQENESIVDLLSELNDLYAVTKELQRPTLTLSGARRLFDRVLETFPLMRDRIGPNASIVNYFALERGKIKLQRNASLTSAERTACAAFRDAQPTARATEEKETIVRRSEKAQGRSSRGVRRCGVRATDLERLREVLLGSEVRVVGRTQEYGSYNPRGVDAVVVQ